MLYLLLTVQVIVLANLVKKATVVAYTAGYPLAVKNQQFEQRTT